MTSSPADVAAYIDAAEKAAWEVPGLPADTPVRDIASVGIIGAGTMGGGIAMNFATAGIPVRIVDTTEEALARGLAIVRKNYQRSADKGRFSQDELEARMGRITGSLSRDDLAQCDMIIEAVFEDIELKKTIFSDLDRICKPGAVLATNTSALDIDAIARFTSRPEDVIGMHFFSPANVMKLVEIVRARKTADDVVATIMAVTRKIGKVATLVGVCPGFVGNRILAYRGIAAGALLNKGVMPWDIDAAFNEFGFKMGPYQMSDLAGLDIGWKKGATTANPIRDALCEIDRRGQKTGAGFYDYDESRNRTPSPVAEDIIRDITGIKAGEEPRLTNAEILEICLSPMINEAVKVLEENKAQRATDVDVVWLNGYGWPRDKGGPMFYGDTVGAATVLKAMETLAKDDPRLAPADTLRALAASGGKFTEIDTGGLKTA